MYINTFRLLAFIILFAIIIIVEIPFKKLFKEVYKDLKNIGGWAEDTYQYESESDFDKDSLEKALDITAIKKMLPMQAGDVYQTFADTSGLERDYNYKPEIAVDKGIQAFVSWFKYFYNK